MENKCTYSTLACYPTVKPFTLSIVAARKDVMDEIFLVFETPLSVRVSVPRF